MTRNLLLLGVFTMSMIYVNAQFGGFVQGTANAIEKKKQENNIRSGNAPELAQMPQATDASLNVMIPVSESGVKPKFTSTFLQEHAGEVVFSKSFIPREISSAEKLTNSFNMGDAIEVRFVMPTSLCNYYLYTPGNNVPAKNTKPFYTTLVYIDGDMLHPVFMGGKYLDKDMRDAVTFRDVIFAVGDEKKFNNTFLVDKLNALSAGSHQIKVELWAGDISNTSSPRSLKPVSTGEFTLIKKDGQKFVKGKTMNDVTAKMTDPELEASALKAVNEYVKVNGLRHHFTDLKIISSDWGIQRNELSGVILRRVIDIYAKGVWPDGHCEGVIFGISQEHDGTGYSKVCNYYGIGSSDQLECD